MKTPAKSHALSVSLLAAVLAAGSQAWAINDHNPKRHFRSPQLYDHTNQSAPWTGTHGETSGTSAGGGVQLADSMEDALFPPEAKPGECWTRVLVPPPVKTETERVLVREASFEIVEIPAEFETVEEQVVVKPASQRQEVIPATYKEVQEQVVVKPEVTRQIPVPAEYETVTERVLVKPERSYWKKGHGPLERIDNMTGEIMCYVTEPAEYETVTRNVLRTPATVREETIPAEYTTVTRTVVDQPAQVRTIEIPAEYETMQVQRVVSASRTERRELPAEYATVEREVRQGESRLEWRRILCETNADAQVIGDLQIKLKEEGYDAGEVDGIWGRRTARALADFQDSRGLAQAGLTYETLQALQIQVE